MSSKRLGWILCAAALLAVGGLIALTSPASLPADSDSTINLSFSRAYGQRDSLRASLLFSMRSKSLLG